MDIKDVPSHLGIGLEVVQSTFNSLVKEGLGVIIDESFITPKYTRAQLEEISDLVNDKGMVELTNLTYKYRVPLAYMRDLINQNLNSLPEGV